MKCIIRGETYLGLMWIFFLRGGKVKFYSASTHRVDRVMGSMPAWVGGSMGMCMGSISHHRNNMGSWNLARCIC
jgi:hypothetical protein